MIYKSTIISNWDKLPVVIDLHTAALIYDVTETTVKSWLKQGVLKGFKIGRKWYFDKEYLKTLSDNKSTTERS